MFLKHRLKITLTFKNTYIPSHSSRVLQNTTSHFMFYFKHITATQSFGTFLTSHCILTILRNLVKTSNDTNKCDDSFTFDLDVQYYDYRADNLR